MSTASYYSVDGREHWKWARLGMERMRIRIVIYLETLVTYLIFFTFIF